MTEDKGTALITGASSGLGATYADRLARRGYDLILVARDTARLEALADRLCEATGQKIEVLTADLIDAAALAIVEKRLADDPTITLLVNNAGMSLSGPLLTAEIEQVDRLIALNISAPTRLARAAATSFVARQAGAIVNIASVLALAPELFDGVYSGSKAYLLNLSHSLAKQTAPAGIYVQAVLPGATRTEIWDRAGKSIKDVPADWLMEVDDLVDAALLGFDRREAVTIPPLADEGQWTAMEELRQSMMPHLSRKDVAERYRDALVRA
jgi:short-subunit dehydrogenase